MPTPARAPRKTTTEGAKTEGTKGVKGTSTDTALTPLQQLFVTYYCGECYFNGVESARRAGYQGSYSVLGGVAYENLKKPQIAAAVRERLESLSSGAEEAIQRTSRRARGTLANVLRIETDEEDKPTGATLDLLRALETGEIHNLKKVKQRRGQTKSGEAWTEVEVELVDPAAADELLLRVYRRIGCAPEDMLTPAQLTAEAIRLLENEGYTITRPDGESEHATGTPPEGAANPEGAGEAAARPAGPTIIVQYIDDHTTTAPRRAGGD